MKKKNIYIYIHTYIYIYIYIDLIKSKYLNVSTFDLGEGTNIQDWGLSGQVFELKGSQARPVQSESSSVTEHEP